MKTSRIITSSRETVSLETLKDKLPENLFNAVCETMQNNSPMTHISHMQEEFFNADPVEPLNEKEREELFDQLGNEYVRNHFSTETLRSFLDTDSSHKKTRK